MSRHNWPFSVRSRHHGSSAARREVKFDQAAERGGGVRDDGRVVTVRSSCGRQRACRGSPVTANEFLSCEELERKMDEFDGSGSGGMSEALGYLALYAIAKAKGCAFLDDHNRYGKDPWKGGEGKLHMRAWDDQTGDETPMLTVDPDNHWLYARDHSDASLFKFVPTGESGWKGKRYFLAVASGPDAGKCLSSFDDPIAHIEAHPCDENSDRWAISDNGGSGWSAWSFDNFSSTGEHRGVLDVPRNGLQSMIVYPWNGDPNQMFHFRPPNYR